MKQAIFFLCLAACALPSCKSAEIGLNASIDESGQRYTGPSYAKPERATLDLGYNFDVVLEAFDIYSFADDAAEQTKEGRLGFIGHLGFVSKASHQAFAGGEDKVRLNYIHAPLYFAYRSLPANGNHFFGGLGPYVGYGIGGKLKNVSGSFSSEGPAFGSKGIFNRFDMGIAATGGYKTASTLSLSLAYDYGLANIESNGGGDKTRNRSVSLNVGYSLSKLLKK